MTKQTIKTSPTVLQTLMSVLAYLAIHITFLARASLDHS